MGGLVLGMFRFEEAGEEERKKKENRQKEWDIATHCNTLQRTATHCTT